MILSFEALAQNPNARSSSSLQPSWSMLGLREGSRLRALSQLLKGLYGVMSAVSLRLSVEYEVNLSHGPVGLAVVLFQLNLVRGGFQDALA